jgi:hypothetical protein
MRRLLPGLLAVTAVVAGVLGTAVPASASAPHNGRCENGEECFWPYSNKVGSVYDETGVSENHASEIFHGPGAFQGHVVNDFAMSFWNHADFLSVRVCAHSYVRGPCISVGAGYARNTLPPEISNRNSSHLRL